MTPMSENPVAVTQALRPVIQADRDAAADYAREHWLWPAPHVEGIRIGSEAWDAYHLTQAFARHRLAGLEREADGAPGGALGEGEPDTAFAISKRRHEDRQAALASATEAPPVAGMGEDERSFLAAAKLLDGFELAPPFPPGSLIEAAATAMAPSLFVRHDDQVGPATLAERDRLRRYAAQAARVFAKALRDYGRKAALTKPTPPASVSGEVVTVPREPTIPMEEAGGAQVPCHSPHDVAVACEVWKAMLSAASSAPGGEEGQFHSGEGAGDQR